MRDELTPDIFSFTEQSCVVTVTNVNPSNPMYGTTGGNTTTDGLFLLDHTEVEKYFPNPADRKAYYCYNKEKATDWWVATPGEHGGKACYVSTTGELDYSGYSVIDFGTHPIYVRVAMWVDISA